MCNRSQAELGHSGQILRQTGNPSAGCGPWRRQRGAEFGVEHQALSAIVSGLVAGGGLSGRFARQLEGESGHAVGRAGIAVAPIAQSNLVRSSDIEIVAAFAEEIHSLLWHGLWQVSVSARRVAQQFLKFRMQSLRSLANVGCMVFEARLSAETE